MDPDLALRELVKMARLVIATSADPRVLALAEAVLNLHEWITKGGYLPADWQAPATVLADDQGRSGL